MNNVPSNTLAGALIGLTLVCATVLASKNIIPAEVITNMLSAALGGGLAYLNPSVKAASSS